VIQYSAATADIIELTPTINRIMREDVLQFSDISQYPHQSDTSAAYVSIVLVRVDDTSHILLDKTLYNIGLDMLSTDIVMLSPPGFRVSPEFISYAYDKLAVEAKSDDDKPIALLPPPFVLNRDIDWSDIQSSDLHEVTAYNEHTTHGNKCHGFQPQVLGIAYSVADRFIALGKSLTLSEAQKLGNAEKEVLDIKDEVIS
jgi:hypothetical protein